MPVFVGELLETFLRTGVLDVAKAEVDDAGFVFFDSERDMPLTFDVAGDASESERIATNDEIHGNALVDRVMKELGIVTGKLFDFAFDEFMKKAHVRFPFCRIVATFQYNALAVPSAIETSSILEL